MKSKTNKFLTLILAIVTSIAITSCVQDDDYTIPSSLGDDENEALANMLANATEVDMAYVKALYNENGAETVPFFVENDIYVKGYVSSSDKSGNFFKEFYMQDAPSNPTGALKITLDQVDTYNQYNQGRELYISLKGLQIGEERVGNGIITIGGGTEFDQYGGTVTRINENQIRTSLLRSEVTEEIIPLSVGFSALTGDHVGVFVQVDGVEFADNLAGKRYFDPVQVYDTQRTLQSCGGFTHSNLALETSSFASFKEHLLPTGNGSIKAIVNKTFDGSTLILALNDVEDVDLTDSRCTLLNPDDFSEIMGENFDTSINYDDLDTPGWTNFAEAGSKVWRERVFSGNGYAEFSSYNSNENLNIGWLVSPGIDLEAQGIEFLNFKMAQHHLESADNSIEVFVSTDFDGVDVLGATWEQIGVTLPTESTSWYEYIDSGLVNLSSYSGTLHVAFKVTGDGNDLTGGYQLDDFSIIAEN